LISAAPLSKKGEQMISNCPGAKNLKTPSPENIRCPFCFYELETWTDEVKAKCPNCKKTVVRKQKQSCLDWCKYARACLGDNAYKNYIENKHISIKEELLKELEAYFGNDLKRINHAKQVMDYANELLKEEDATWHIVIPAGILHDVGIKIAEEKHGSAVAHYRESEGPAVAGKILLKLGFKKEDIEEICQIIAHHHSPGKIDTQNFKVLYDADWLVNLKDEVGTKDKAKLAMAIDKLFLTNTAKALAAKVYLS
jgi:HD superfamily phosphodiesterase